MGSTRPTARGPARWLWLAAGWLSVAIGGIGVVVPGLPTTVFFIVAASCFARSSPRFEGWVLGLRVIGPMVRDHRDGLGMPRRAKAAAVTMMLGAATAAAVLVIDNDAVAATVVVLALFGAGYVLWRVPTREVVLIRRAAGD